MIYGLYGKQKIEGALIHPNDDIKEMDNVQDVDIMVGSNWKLINLR